MCFIPQIRNCCLFRRNQFLNQSFSSVRELRRETKIQQQQQQHQQSLQQQLNERPLYRVSGGLKKSSSVEQVSFP